MKKIGIFGCSGFARETADIAYSLNMQPIFIGKDEKDLSELGHTYESMLESDLSQFSNLPLAIGIGENKVRQKIFQSHPKKTFVNLIHPSASFGFQQEDLLASKKGLIICAGVRMTNNIEIGDACIINLNATIGHDCVIEDFVNIAPCANISGNVHIKPGCWIGTNAAINQGNIEKKLTIGENTIIGSGSVVTKPCDENSVYAGIPARKIK